MVPDPVRQFHAVFLSDDNCSEFRQGASEHGSADRASDEAVQPVVVVVFRLQLPFVHRASASLRFDAILGGQVFRQKLVNSGDTTIERERSLVADGNGEARVNEALPIVRVINDVPDSPLLGYARHHPVKAQAVARLFPIFRHRL